MNRFHRRRLIGLACWVVVGAVLVSVGKCRAQGENKTASSFPPGSPIHYNIPKGLETPEYLRFEKAFQSGERCGPNSVYIILRLLGVTVTYDEVLQRIPVGPQGANLDDIRKAATHFGLITEVRKLTPEDLAQAPMPIVIHMNSADTKEVAGQPGKKDHFLVICRQLGEEGYFQGIDTTNGVLASWSLQSLARNFSGYCLVVKGRTYWSRLSTLDGMLAASFVAILGGNLGLMWWSKKRGARV